MMLIPGDIVNEIVKQSKLSDLEVAYKGKTDFKGISSETNRMINNALVHVLHTTSLLENAIDLNDLQLSAMTIKVASARLSDVSDYLDRKYKHLEQEQVSEVEKD